MIYYLRWKFGIVKRIFSKKILWGREFQTILKFISYYYFFFFWNTRSNEPIPTLKTFPPQSVSYNFNWRVITRKAKRLKKKVFRDSCIQITLLVRQGWNGLRAVDSDMLSRWPLNVIKRICDRISGLVRKIRMTNGPRYSVRNHSPVPRPFFPPFFWFMLRAGRVRGASLVENLDRPPFIFFPFSFFFFSFFLYPWIWRDAGSIYRYLERNFFILQNFTSFPLSSILKYLPFVTNCNWNY